ncbi:MAG: UTP--glucose-1-phosphate uridylyltransferase [Clostridia bacterium]|nr:UTP--glucose-1-phosphate uridylyltransferase [Clostridia bacterium]
MKITKAVIPAAGLGTRMLPVSKSVPKEMLPIDAKPAMQYLVEEAAKSGITDILIVSALGKDAIERHFTACPQYEKKLIESGKQELYKSITDINKIANIYYTYQHEAGGLGQAIRMAKEFVKDEPFAVLYGDDVVISENPATGQLIKAYEKYGKSVAGVKSVPREIIGKYCSLKVENLEGNLYSVSDMIEKPKENEIFSNLAILGRVVLEPCIFDILDRTPGGIGGELQLTDAMAALSRESGMIAVEFEGTRYDMGNKLSYLCANVEVAVNNPEYGEEFRKYLKEFVKSL